MCGAGSAVCFQDLGEARRYATAISGGEEEIEALFVGVGGPKGCRGAVLELAEPGEVDVEGFYCGDKVSELVSVCTALIGVQEDDTGG